MNPSLVQAAQEIANRSKQPVSEVMSNLMKVWTSLTGQPVYLHQVPSTGTMQSKQPESIEDFD